MQHNIDTTRMEAEARTLAKKTKASDAKELNDIKKYMVMLEWYKKKSKEANKCYYDCFKNGDFQRDVRIEEFMGQLTTYWEDMVAQAERKPQKEGASFRTAWFQSATTFRRMVEPLDIAIFYRDGGRDYINNGRSPLYKLLEKLYEEAAKNPTREGPDSKNKKVSVLLTDDSCFWAHVEDAILSCQSLNHANSTPEQRESSWKHLVKFGEYVTKQIENFAVSPEIFLEQSSFMKWWRMYEASIDAFGNFYTSPLVNFMKSHKYDDYGLPEEA